MTLTSRIQRIERVLVQECASIQIAAAMFLHHRFGEDWSRVSDGEIEAIPLRLNSMREQQSAVADDLEQLAGTEPCEFEPKHIWTLIRAIRVQNKYVQWIDGEGEEFGSERSTSQAAFES